MAGFVSTLASKLSPLPTLISKKNAAQQVGLDSRWGFKATSSLLRYFATSMLPFAIVCSCAVWRSPLDSRSQHSVRAEQMFLQQRGLCCGLWLRLSFCGSSSFAGLCASVSVPTFLFLYLCLCVCTSSLSPVSFFSGVSFFIYLWHVTLYQALG